MVKSPAAVVFAVILTSLVDSVMVTEALPTDAPCWSTTRPDKEPVIFCEFPNPESSSNMGKIMVVVLDITPPTTTLVDTPTRSRDLLQPGDAEREMGTRDTVEGQLPKQS